MKRALLSLLPALLAGCSSYNLAKEDAAADFAWEAAAPGTLRLDIVPPSEVDGRTLLPQSLVVAPGDYEGLDLELLPTLTLTGNVLADITTGWNGAVGAPTARVPVEATLSVAGPGGALGGVAISDPLDGSFSLSLPAYRDLLSLQVLPKRGDTAFLALPLDLATYDPSADAVAPVLSPLLSLGAPIYGRVVDASGAGIARAPLRLGRADGSILGSRFEASETGWFVAHVAEPGAYRIQVDGGPAPVSGPVLPSTSVEVVVDDLAQGARVDVPVGEVDGIVVSGAVEDEDGAAVRGAEIVFESLSLEGANGSLVVTRTTDDTGRFYVEALPGRWRVEVRPPHDAAASPVVLEEVVVADSAQLGVVTLPAPEDLEGVVMDAGGAPAAGVLVTARQDGFGGQVWTATTGGDGSFALRVQAGDYALTLTPPDLSVDGALTVVSARTNAPATWTLDPGTVLSGALGLDGTPVPWALIDVIDASTGARVGLATTDGDGTFSMRVHVEEPAAFSGDTAAE